MATPPPDDHLTGTAFAGALPSHRPRPDEVERVILEAAAHPLGVDFLRHGALDSVAAIFQAHAFTVHAAREELRSRAAATIQTHGDLHRHQQVEQGQPSGR
jgi:hypothetical protein